jgi:membrane protein DedA with SNARE-associated domain/rhodanese-related sulfurtransferase
MTDFSAWFTAYGMLAVFGVVFVKQLGAPVPALPLLVFAGAQGVQDGVLVLQSLALATVAAVLADAVWFVAGRRHGRSVLGLLCRVSMSPHTCIRKSELAFERGGLLAVLFAKFIPGVSMVIRPLAGAFGMSAAVFLALDAAGSALWAGSGLAAGLLFQRQLAALAQAAAGLGSGPAVLAGIVLALYVLGRLASRWWVHRKLGRLKRVRPEELAAMLQRGENVLVLDVRGPVGASGARIPGALSAPPGSQAFENLPPHDAGAVVVAYCDCPSDATAARAALMLARRGRFALVLEGGLGAWLAAGLSVEDLAPGA